nr:hypothetical protein HDU93_007203 [Gonapodya sp. JEL0774]
MDRLCCSHYALDDFTEMERRILSVLDFDMEYKGPGDFLDCLGEISPITNANGLLRRESSTFAPQSPALFTKEAADHFRHTSYQYQMDAAYLPANITAGECARFIGPLSAPVLAVAHQLVEASMLDSRFSCLRPSRVAFASVLAADTLLEQNGFTEAARGHRLYTILLFDRTLGDVAQVLAQVGAAFVSPVPPTSSQEISMHEVAR